MTRERAALIAALTGGVGYGVYQFTIASDARMYSRIMVNERQVAGPVACRDQQDEADVWLGCAPQPEPSATPTPGPCASPPPERDQCSPDKTCDCLETFDGGCTWAFQSCPSPPPSPTAPPSSPTPRPSETPRPTPTPSSTPTPGPTPTPPLPSASVGYGAVTKGGREDLPGLVHEVYQVTNLNDSGPGSIRDGVVNRSGRPRNVQIKVGGTVVLKSAIKIEEPFITIDGRGAPAPGFNLQIAQGGGVGVDPEFSIKATHDIEILGIRIAGTWDPSKFTKNTATISIDGDAAPNIVAWDPNPNICDPGGRNSCRIVIDGNTLASAADSGSDFWCGIKDLTFSHNFVLDSFQPRGTGCKGTYNETANPEKVRKRITEYANVYAYNGERQPKLNEGVYDYDFINNLVAFWQDYGTGSGTGPAGNGMMVDDDGVQERHNTINNVFLPGGVAPPQGYSGQKQAELCAADNDDCSGSDRCREKRDCVWGASCKCDGSSPNCSPMLVADPLHYAGNVFGPKHNLAECVSTAKGQNPFPRPYALAIHAVNQLKAKVLDVVGAPHKTARESQVLAEVAVELQKRVPQQ